MSCARHIRAVLLLWGTVSLCGVTASWDAAVRAHAQSAPRDTQRERLLSIGKDLFVERCAKCHNERGDKPLSSGAPLNQRKLSREVIERNVTGRFKSATEEQRRAVALYIESFLAK